jgi:hypothetical protein
MSENDLQADIELVERVIRASTMNVSDELSHWLARVEAWNRIKPLIKQPDNSDHLPDVRKVIRDNNAIQNTLAHKTNM